MKKKIILQAILILFILLLVVGCNKVPKFDHYGVYVKGNKGFTEIKGYEWSGMNAVCQNSHNYDLTPILVKDKFEIYVYSPKAKLMNYKLLEPNLKIEEGNIVHAVYAVGLNSPGPEIYIKPIGKKDDMVKIVFQDNSGVLILLNKDKNIGYLFNLKKKSNKSSANFNRQEILLNLNKIASAAEVFYKTPVSHGGAGRSWSSGIDDFGKSLSYYSYNASTNTLLTRHGSFIFSLNSDNTVLTIIGIGDEKGKDRSTGVKATLTISGAADLTETKINN
ncbi:MAG: hypothetical protein DRJ01_14005 [Bacteroidetes bacterium]|nr:MAG: hypothetical protein DRJ01_14005 [Bacteroidota bacterium]